ncbi:zinc-binding alcohol dehydrogenase family protein [Pedobacter mucosus]|uniref:zinc-binding alcohol dehydrogenase family protein n=1 Tax=Pedobacter mucosus TaxID=2895286 RepID=UPI001EE3EA70|nr:zinc-binding alcohol dehydrogenase family protein [Pedobacter mucosus]UKT66013.1 zinc-binding alcohol dehydrogenase family protein [Pedobacter mucosus]
MKAVVLHQPGNADQLILEELSIPIPNQDQVLIKVNAFGLNRSELMTRKGLSPDVSFPRVLGIECVGEVENDPSGTFKQGQKVAAFMGNMGRLFDGSYAEYTVLPKAILSSFESTLSWEILGALPEMFQTAYGSLHLALDIKPGETLLIRGGTSSVGLLAAQLAKIAGAKVISTTRDETKRHLLLENGADQVLIDNGELLEQFTTGRIPKVDKVLELVGTTTLKDSLVCTAAFGKVCMTGMLSEQWSVQDFDPMGYIPATVSLTVYDSGQFRVEEKLFQDFITQVEEGLITPPIKKVFNLEEIVAAHQFMESNAGGGKIVVLT